MKRLLIKTVSLLLLSAFFANTACYGLATLPASQNPIAKREILAALQRTQIRYAESEDAIMLLNANDASCLLLSSGKYLVTKEVAQDDIKLLRAIIHEDIEAIMQIIAKEDRYKYQGIKELILKYFPPSKDNKFPIDLYVNHTVASAFEWLILMQERMLLKDEISSQEANFVNAITPIIVANKHNYFTGEFWDFGKRKERISKALNNGVVFYQVANSAGEHYDNEEEIPRASMPSSASEEQEGFYEPKIIILDWDGTVVDTAEQWQDIWKDVLGAFIDNVGIDSNAVNLAKEEFMAAYFHLGLSDNIYKLIQKADNYGKKDRCNLSAMDKIAPMLALPPEILNQTGSKDNVFEKLLHIVNEYVYLKLTDQVNEISDSVALIKEAGRRGIEIYVVSGSPLKTLQASASKIGLSSIIPEKNIFSTTDSRKDKSTLIGEIVAGKRINLNEILMIGDSVSDVEAAKKARIVAIGFSQDEAKTREMIRAGADIVTDRLNTNVLQLKTLAEPPWKWFEDKAALEFVEKSLRYTYGSPEFGLTERTINEVIKILTSLKARVAGGPSALESIMAELKPMITSEGFKGMYTKYKSEDKSGHILGLIKDHIEERVAKSGSEGCVVVDIGCGNNALAQEITSQISGVKKVIGTDIFKSPVAFKEGKKIKFRKQTNRTDFPLENETADVVIMAGMFHFLQDSELSEFLANAKRILKPGGTVILLDDMYAKAGMGEVKFKNPELESSFSALPDDSKIHAMALIEYMGGTVIPGLVSGKSPGQIVKTTLPGNYNFRTAEELKEIIEVSGLSVTESTFLGFPSGRLHLNPQGLIIAKNNIDSSAHKEHFGKEPISDLEILLPHLEQFQFPSGEEPPKVGHSKTVTLREIIESQPFEDYKVPVFDSSRYNQTVADAHKQIAAAGYRPGAISIRGAIQKFFPDKAEELEEYMKLHNPKETKLRMIRMLWKRERAIGGYAPLTLLKHAETEWEIINRLIDDDSGFEGARGNPFLDTRDVLELYNVYFGEEFKSIRNNKMSFNFMAHMLLLHDLGKYRLGEKGHEKRSEAILGAIFKNNYFGLSVAEKSLLMRVIGIHSQIELINSEENKKKFEDMIREHLSYSEALDEKELMDILRIWIVFRVAECVQAADFSFPDNGYFQQIQAAYNTAKQIIHKLCAEKRAMSAFKLITAKSSPIKMAIIAPRSLETGYGKVLSGGFDELNPPDVTVDLISPKDGESMSTFAENVRKRGYDLAIINLHGAHNEEPIAFNDFGCKTIILVHRSGEAIGRLEKGLYKREEWDKAFGNAAATVLLGNARVADYQTFSRRVVGIPHGFSGTDTPPMEDKHFEAGVVIGSSTIWSEMRSIRDVIALVKEVRKYPGGKKAFGYVAGLFTPYKHPDTGEVINEVEMLKRGSECVFLSAQGIKEAYRKKGEFDDPVSFKRWLFERSEKGKKVIVVEGSLRDDKEVAALEALLVDFSTEMYHEIMDGFKPKDEYSGALHRNPGSKIAVGFNSGSMRDMAEEGIGIIYVEYEPNGSINFTQAAQNIIAYISKPETYYAALKQSWSKTRSLTTRHVAEQYLKLVKEIVSDRAGDVIADKKHRAETRSSVLAVVDLYDMEFTAVLLTDLLYAQLQEDRTYEIKYDTSRLTASQIEIIEEYAKLLQLRSSNPDSIKLRPFSSAQGSKESLIAVYCAGKDFKGEGHVDVAIPEGELKDYLLRITGMINIALASSNIPDNLSREDVDKYRPIVSYIKNQYKSILGKDLAIPDNPEDILKIIRRIVLGLPKSMRMSLDQIEKYNRYAKEALIAA